MSLLLGRACSSHICQVRWSRFLTPAARICSDEWLRMDKFMEVRQRTQARFGDHMDAFATRMRKFADPTDAGMIFSDDIKNYLHLIENKPEDVDVLKQMLVKYAEQNSLRFQTFSLGPVIMRVLLYINNAELGMDIIKEEKLNDIFNEAASYAIMANLLYRQQKYNEVIEIFDLFSKQHIEGQRWPAYVMMPFFAACYKLNTAEAFEKMAAVYADMLKAGVKPMKRLTHLVAALAIKQTDPIEGLEIINNSQNNFYVDINLKVMALSDAGRVKEALDLLQDKYTNNGPKDPPSIYPEAVDHIKSALDNSDDTELKSQFANLEPQLKMMQGESIDDILCKEMTQNTDKIREKRFDRRDDGRRGREGGGRFDDRSDRRFDDRSDRRFDDRRFDRRQQYDNRRQAYAVRDNDNYSRQNTGYRENN